MRTVTKSNHERDFFSFMSKLRKYADILLVLAQNKSILHMPCIWQPLFVLWRKKIEPFMFHEGINAKVFRRSIAFAIEVLVTSSSSSLEYTISVHADAEKNVCNIVVSTETPQTSTNPSQTLIPVFKLAHLPLPHPMSSTPRHPQTLAQPFAQMCYRC